MVFRPEYLFGSRRIPRPCPSSKTEPGFHAAEITFLLPGLGGGVCRANGARPPLTKLRTS